MKAVLNTRLSDLLKISVEEYIKTATPIVSNTLAVKGENKFSPATIRNDLKTLEQMGYLYQVHASGGRVPTTMGYSAYVALHDGVTFAGDLINDLHILTRLAERIEKKISGSCNFPIRSWDYDQMLERRQNIYKLLEVPDLEMSAFYLIIKEKMDGKK